MGLGSFSPGCRTFNLRYELLIYIQGHNNKNPVIFFPCMSLSDVKLVFLWWCRHSVHQLAVIASLLAFPAVFPFLCVCCESAEWFFKARGRWGSRSEQELTFCGLWWAPRAGWDLQNRARFRFPSLLFELHPSLMLAALLWCVRVFIRLSGLLPSG